MENAAKAIIISGGIFFAIALLTFGVYTYTSLNRLANEQDAQTEQQQLVNFNKSYEAYNKSIMYGTDLISVINKANDNNKLYGTDTTYKITIRFKFVTAAIYEYDVDEGKRIIKHSEKYFKTDTSYTNDDLGNIQNLTGGSFDDFKRRLFKCTGVGYSDVTGRINSMSFEEIELTEEQYKHK